MDLKLLLIAADTFPAHLTEHMEDYGFTTIEARGRLKIKSLLETERLDGIVWCHEGYDPSLANDLTETLNQRGAIPLVLLTGNFESPLIDAGIQGTFGILDMAEDPTDLLKAIEYACRKPAQEGVALQEIDFKNLVRQVTGNKTQFAQVPQEALKLQSAWLAVDGNEKRLLSSREEPQQGVFGQLAKWLST